jgi:hypothetical protein
MKLLLLSLITLLLACSSGTQMSMHAGKMIVPGEGTDELRIGMTRAELVELLPETSAEDSSWIDCREKYGLVFLFDSLGQVTEIQFGEGFQGRLPSRVQVGSRIQDIYDAYGTPKAREEVAIGAEGIEDRVLYKTPQGYRISYNRLGLAFRLSAQRRVAEIVVFKPMPNRHIRIKTSEEMK